MNNNVQPLYGAPAPERLRSIEIIEPDIIKSMARAIDRLTEENADLRSEVKLLQEINGELQLELNLMKKKEV